MSFLSGESAMALCPGCKVMLHTKSGKVCLFLVLVCAGLLPLPALSFFPFSQVCTFLECCCCL